MRVQFLLDENVTPRPKTALLRLEPVIDVLRVGEPGAPPLGTLDPEVLQYLQVSRRMLITFNRKSMPAHINAHRAGGGHLYGLLWLRPNVPTGRLAQELYLVWEASEAEEWVDRLDWVPF